MAEGGKTDALITTLVDGVDNFLKPIINFLLICLWYKILNSYPKYNSTLFLTGRDHAWICLKP